MVKVCNSLHCKNYSTQITQFNASVSEGELSRHNILVTKIAFSTWWSSFQSWIHKAYKCLMLGIRICKFLTHSDVNKLICQWQTDWYWRCKIIPEHIYQLSKGMLRPWKKMFDFEFSSAVMQQMSLTVLKSLTWWVTVDKVLVGRIMSKKNCPTLDFLISKCPILGKQN